MRKLINKFAVAVLLAGYALGVNAAPMTITSAAFDGSENVIDFDGIANGTSITSQLAGATFTNVWGFAGTQAQNFVPNGCVANPTGSCDAVTIDFTNTVSMFGLDLITNAGSTDVSLSFFSGATLVNSGIFTVSTDLNFSFYGFQDLVNGFDRVVLDATNNTSNGAMRFDNLRFVEASVPVTGTLALLGIGLLSLGFGLRHKT